MTNPLFKTFSLGMLIYLYVPCFGSLVYVPRSRRDPKLLLIAVTLCNPKKNNKTGHHHQLSRIQIKVGKAQLEQAVGLCCWELIFEIASTFFSTPFEISSSRPYWPPGRISYKIGHLFVVFDAAIAQFTRLQSMLQYVSIKATFPNTTTCCNKNTGRRN